MCVGGGGYVLAQIVWSTFLLRGIFLNFLQGGIIGVLCVIFLQLIGFSLGKKALRVLTSGASIVIRWKVIIGCPHYILKLVCAAVLIVVLHQFKSNLVWIIDL